MNCLLEFSKMTFRIHFIFTFVTGIIFLLTLWWNYISWTFLCVTSNSAHAPPLGVYLISFSSLHVSRIHCNFGLISMVYACYSTRCLLNLLENKRFLHSMHVIALYVCWISFSEKKRFFHMHCNFVFITFLRCFLLNNFIFYMFHHFLLTFSTTSSSWCFVFSHALCSSLFVPTISWQKLSSPIIWKPHLKI